VPERSATLTRVAAVLIILGAFLATNQIAAPELDALAVVSALVALTCGVLALWVMALEYRDDPKGHPILPAVIEIIRIGAIVAGGLAVFGIWRTVVPGLVGPTYTDPVLGLSLILLLVTVFYVTRPMLAASAPARATADSGGPGPVPGAASKPSKTPAAGSPASTDGGSRTMTVVGTIVAIIVVGGYGWVIATLLTRAGLAQDAEWARLIDVQGGLEAAAFAALGALIGVTIQGRSTDAAKAAAAVSAGDAAKATSTLKTVETGLTHVERNASDNTIPSDLGSLGFQNYVATMPEHERTQMFTHVRAPAADDRTLAEIRRLRDLIRDAL